MNKIVILPILAALIFMSAQLNISAKTENHTFQDFLNLFPKKEFPFAVSIQDLEQRAIEGVQNDAIAHKSVVKNEVSIMSAFIPVIRAPQKTNNLGDGIFMVSERGTNLYLPIARLEHKDFFIVCVGEFFMEKASMSKYLLSIFDKSGKHILTHLVAAHQGDVLESFVLDKDLSVTFKSYVVKKITKHKMTYTYKNSKKENIYDWVNIELLEKNKDKTPSKSTKTDL